MNSLVSRRTFLGASGLVLTGAAFSRYSLAAEGQLYAYVGRSTPGFAGAATGGGIDVFRVNMADGSMQPVGTTGPEVQDLNSDGMCTSADGRFLYCVNRTNGLGGVPGMGGGVVAFAINRADGTLKYLNTQPTMGAMPVGVRIDKTNSRVIVGNHGAVSRAVRIERRNGKPVLERPTDDATVAMYPVGQDGSLGAPLDVAVLDREPAKGYVNPRPVVLGPTAANQIGPAVHQVALDQSQRWIIATDNGYDRIYVYPFSPTSKSLKGKWFQVAPGSAPRHIAIHPSAPYFFITNEREASASAFHFDAKTGDVQHLQTIATVVDGQPAPPPAADGTPRRISPSDIRMHPTGRFVYTSNRVPGGPDTIAVFAVDAGSGKLTRVEVAETGGAGQREINLDPSGRFLFSCNTASNDVTVLAIDAATGKLTRTAKATVQRPMVIDFAVV